MKSPRSIIQFIQGLLKIPCAFQGQDLLRKESCIICGADTGLKIGAVDFWDLHEANLVKCLSCNHIQIDPKLPANKTETGCSAYFHFENRNIPKKEQQKNKLRNFRRGILFAYQLKKQGFNPANLLEIGPGSGHFALGIRYIFPSCAITVMDIVDQVLEKNRVENNFKVIKSSLECFHPTANETYDLIIARDLLEHLNDITTAIGKISSLLQENGLFHFLTPNGHEDVWKHYLHWKKTGNPSELLINHVNYFNGSGLKSLLAKNKLFPIKYYTYQIKTTFRGQGWQFKKKLEAAQSIKRSASQVISQTTVTIRIEKGDQGISKWYFRGKFRKIGIFFAWYHHQQLVRITPQYNLGHEFFGLFKKITNGASQNTD